MASIIVIPAYLLAWFSKVANTKGCISGMCFGILYCIVIAVGYIEPGVNDILIGITVNFIISLLVSLFSYRPLEATVSETYYWSDRFKVLKLSKERS